MADKFKAIQDFWSSFGLQAYDENSVPSGDSAPLFPYITYSLSYDTFDHPVSMVVNIWTRSSSWSTAFNKFAEVEKAIGAGKYITSVFCKYSHSFLADSLKAACNNCCFSFKHDSSPFT